MTTTDGKTTLLASTGINLVGKPSVLESAKFHATVPVGGTIESIIGKVSDDVRVTLEGDYIPREMWGKIRPKDGATILIHRAPRGGNAGQAFAIVAAIVISIYAPQVGAYLANTYFAGSQLAAGLITAGIFIAAGALIQGFITPPSSRDSSSSEYSRYNALTAVTNRPNPFGLLPKIFGSVWTTPPLAAYPYTEVREGDQQFIYSMMAIGYGNLEAAGVQMPYGSNKVTMIKEDGNVSFSGHGNIDQTKIKVGETTIDQFDDFEIQIGYENDVDLFIGDVYEDRVNVGFNFANEPFFAVRSTTQATSEASIDLTFPQGLYSMNKTGDKASGASHRGLFIEEAIINSVSVSTSTTTFNGIANIYQYDGGAEGLLKRLYYQPNTKFLPAGTYTDQFSLSDGTNYTIEFVISATNTPQITSMTKNSVAYTGFDDTFAAGLTLGDYALFKIEYSTFGDGIWTTVPTALGNGLYMIPGGEKDPFAKSYSMTFPSKSQYDIRITRVQTVFTYTNYQFGDASWSTLRSIDRSNNFSIPNILLLAIKMRATDQINGNLDNVSIYVRSMLPDFDDNGLLGTYSISENPSAAYLETMIGVQNTHPIPETRIDFPELVYWRDWCDSNAITYSWIHANEETMIQRMMAITPAGFAKYTIVDGKFSVVTDKVQANSHIINPRSARAFSSTKQFIDMPHAFRVEYIDATTNQRTEVIAYDDGYDASNASKFEVLSTQGINNPLHAWKYGRYHLAQATLRPEVYTVEMDIEQVRMTRGDSVKLAYDVMLVGLSWGRVSSIGNTVIGVDELLPFEDGKTYAMQVRKEDGTIIEFPVSASSGEHNSVNWTKVEGVNIGDLFTFGEASKVSIDAKIANIGRGDSDNNATVTMVDAANNIFDAWVGDIPAFDAGITLPPELRNPLPPIITGLSSNINNLVKFADGSFKTGVTVSWVLQSSSTPVTNVELRVTNITGGTSGVTKKILVDTNDRGTFTITDGIYPGDEYRIEVAAISPVGNYSQNNNSQTITAFTVSDYVDVNVLPTITNIESGTNQLIFQGDGTLVTRVLVEWDAPLVSANILQYEIDFKPTGDINWSSTTVPGNIQYARLSPVKDTVEYDIRIRAVYDSDVKSNYVEDKHVVSGKSEPPSDVVLANATIKDRSILIEWEAVTDIDFYEYELRKGTDWNTATFIGRFKATQWLQEAATAGVNSWLIKAIDTSRNYSVNAKRVDLTIQAPQEPAVTGQVIDNNVLLYFESVPGTLPIDSYQIEKDTVVIGNVKSTFTTIFETQSGDYNYDVTAYDIAGNPSTTKRITLSVSEPPDYVLNAKFNSLFDGTLTNAYGGDVLILPVNTTETWGDYLTATSTWSTLDAEVAAGYPAWLTPQGGLTGVYQETYDYGTLLPATLITITPTVLAKYGNPSITPKIEISTDNLNWTPYNNVWQIYATNFRYVRFTLTVIPNDDSEQIVYSNIEFKLDSKIKDEAINGTANAADVGGTTITFSVPFVDVTSIIVTPSLSSGASYAVYDFVDTPYPTDFKVLLYDLNGNRVSGTFSAIVKGY